MSSKTMQCERKELVFLARKHFLADELANKFSFFIIGFDESERMRQLVCTTRSMNSDFNKRLLFKVNLVWVL